MQVLAGLLISRPEQMLPDPAPASRTDVARYRNEDAQAAQMQRMLYPANQPKALQ